MLSRLVNRPTLPIFLVATVLRLGYLGLLATQHTSAEVLTLFPDSARYANSASFILGWNDTGEAGLFFAGPGYDAYLALFFSLFGLSAWPVLISQAILSGLGCTLVVLIAKEAIPGCSYAPLLAGLLAALSLTSISLSSSILSESLFFVLQAASVVCLLRGIALNKWSWFLASGLLAGVAILVKPVAQLWPLAVVLVVLFMRRPVPSVPRRELLSKAVIGMALAVVVTLGWAARNGAVHGHWTVAGTGAGTARDYLAASTLVRMTGMSLSDTRAQWDALEPADNLRIVLETARRYPVVFAEQYVLLVTRNVTARSVLQAQQLPMLGGLWGAEWFILLQTALGFLLPLLALAGLWILPRMSAPAVTLVAVWVYFALMSGVTFGQGSRIFYPAQMAWAVLVALAIENLAEAARRRLARGNRRFDGGNG